MEVKINREIRNYTESMFFGLSLRQFIFSVLACAVAVGLYFLLKPYLGTETVSWVCILGAAPFAALGFVKYAKLYKGRKQTVKRAADNKRRYAPGEGSIPPVLLSRVSKGVPPLAHDFACKV